jgi:hypothetical protein
MNVKQTEMVKMFLEKAKACDVNLITLANSMWKLSGLSTNWKAINPMANQTLNGASDRIWREKEKKA